MYKKIISLCLICSMIIGSNNIVFGATNTNILKNDSSISDINKPNSVATEFTADDLAKIEKTISRQADGTLKLDKEAAKKLGYKENDLDKLEIHLSSLNKMILSGDYKTDESLNIIDVKSVQAVSEKSLPSISENGVSTMAVAPDGYDWVQTHWWGVERYANNQNSKNLANQFTALAIGSPIPQAATTFLSSVFKLGSLFTAELTQVVSLVGIPYFGTIAYQINTRNTGLGVSIRLTWVGTFSIQAQTDGWTPAPDYVTYYCKGFQKFYNDVTQTSAPLTVDGWFSTATVKAFNTMGTLIQGTYKAQYCLNFQKWYNGITQTSSPLAENGYYGSAVANAYDKMLLLLNGYY